MKYISQKHLQSTSFESNDDVNDGLHELIVEFSPEEVAAMDTPLTFFTMAPGKFVDLISCVGICEEKEAVHGSTQMFIQIGDTQPQLYARDFLGNTSFKQKFQPYPPSSTEVEDNLRGGSALKIYTDAPGDPDGGKVTLYLLFRVCRINS